MAALIRWMPAALSGPRDVFAEMARLRRDMERLWDDSFGEGFLARQAGVFPPVNVSEDDSKLYVRMELPGMSADDVDVVIQNDSLVIKGERRIASEPGDVNYHRRERESGSFQRILSLPAHVSPEGVSAVFTNGVLTVTLRKAPEARPRRGSASGC